jgi:hypothetical protein
MAVMMKNQEEEFEVFIFVFILAGQRKTVVGKGIGWKLGGKILGMGIGWELGEHIL